MTLGIADALKPALDELGTEVQVEWLIRTEDRAAGTSTEAATTQAANPKGVTEQFRRDQIDGANVRFGDLMLTLLAQDLDAVPDMNTTRVKLGDRWYTVVGPVEQLYDGDTVAAYRLHLRA